MPGNISTEKTSASLYKYVAEITLAFEGMAEPLTLDMTYIKGIVIDYKFETLHFPIMMITLALENKIADLFIKHEMDGSVIIKLQKYVSNGTNPDMKIDCWEDKFMYVLPKSMTVKGEREKVENQDQTSDVTKTYTIGFAKLDHVNTSKKLFNNVIKKGSVSSNVYNILKEQKFLMEPIQNNRTIEWLIMPPKCSLSTLLDLLNQSYTFYNTPYRFFMDFDITYFLSSSSTITKRKGEQYVDVIINIRDEYNEANMEGMEVDTESMSYIINVSGSYCSVSDTNAADKTYNKIKTGSTGDKRTNADLSKVNGGDFKSKTSYIRLRNDNETKLKSREYANKLNSIIISISTTKVDTSIFCLNKRYTINTEKSIGVEYTGQYLLASRTEVYAPEGEGFNVNITLTFKKIPG